MSRFLSFTGRGSGRSPKSESTHADVALLNSCNIPRSTGTSPVWFALHNSSRAIPAGLLSKLMFDSLRPKQPSGCRSADFDANPRREAICSRRPRISRRERLAGCEDAAEDARRSVRRAPRRCALIPGICLMNPNSVTFRFASVCLVVLGSSLASAGDLFDRHSLAELKLATKDAQPLSELSSATAAKWQPLSAKIGTPCVIVQTNDGHWSKAPSKTQRNSKVHSNVR